MSGVYIDIVPFQEHHQTDIDLLMAEIAKEFDNSVFSPQSRTIKEVSLLATDKYWVALSNNAVVGTIGLSRLDNKAIALKRMFLSAGYRGQGIAKKLLDVVEQWADDNEVTKVYLGTMTQFKDAQKFYKTYGFEEILSTDLPADFQLNPADTVFYKRELNK